MGPLPFFTLYTRVYIGTYTYALRLTHTLTYVPNTYMHKHTQNTYKYIIQNTHAQTQCINRYKHKYAYTLTNIPDFPFL